MNRRLISRRSSIALAAIALALPWASVSAAAPTGPKRMSNCGLSCPVNTQQAPTVRYEGCQEMLVQMDVAKSDVERFLPAGFKEAGFKLADDYGIPDRAGLVLSSRRCKRMVVEGRVREHTIDAHMSVFVERTGPPEPQGFLVVPEVPFGVFVFDWVSNNPDFIDWMRRGTDLHSVRWVPDMVFDFQPGVTGVDPAFFFSSPPPTPSPALVTGVMQVPSSPPIPVAEDFWALTSRGIVQFFSDVPEVQLGNASYRVTVTEPGSPLYEMLTPTSPLERQGTRFIAADPAGSNYAPYIRFEKCVHSPDPKKSFCTGGHTP